jgi:hypothetical protein
MKPTKISPALMAAHRAQGQLPVKCHRVYTAEGSINILMLPAEAVKVANNIVKKMQLIIEHGQADEVTVKLWSASGDSLKFGLEDTRKARRKKKG